jgi:hypothetical protein
MTIGEVAVAAGVGIETVRFYERRGNRMKHLIAALLIVAGSALAVASTSKPAYTCSLTGKKISACCCKPMSDGKMYCTLAKKTITTCCCKPASAKAEMK